VNPFVRGSNAMAASCVSTAIANVAMFVADMRPSWSGVMGPDNLEEIIPLAHYEQSHDH
jgi:hypothetical protein